MKINAETQRTRRDAKRRFDQPGGLSAISRGLRSAATTPPDCRYFEMTLKGSQRRADLRVALAPLQGAKCCGTVSGGVAALNPQLMAGIAPRCGRADGNLHGVMKKLIEIRSRVRT